MAKLRPTFPQLKAEASKIGPEAVQVIESLESKCIRVIQIQSEVKTLNEEQGYTDQYSHLRHPGLRDEVEKEMIRLNIFDGIQIEDFDVDLITGRGPDWVDPIELLRLGVTDEIINKATRFGKPWTSIRVQRRRSGKNKEA